MEDNKHAGIGHVVHNTVVQVSGNGAGAFWWRYNHALLSKSKVPSQNSADVHELLPVLIRLGVGIAGRVTCIDSKVSSIAVACS